MPFKNDFDIEDTGRPSDEVLASYFILLDLMTLAG